jgi:hypothetical protein
MVDELRASGGEMKRGIVLALGATLFTAGLSLGRSDSVAVFGRWSMVYAAALAVVAGLTLCIAVWAARSPWVSSPDGLFRRPSFFAELAALLYGAAYLWSAIGDRSSASRVFDLNITGSIVPGAAILEGLAMVALFAAFLPLAVPLVQRYTAIALPLVSLLALALMLEGAARLVAVVDPEVQGFPTNRSRIWRRRFVQLNQSGVRDVEHAIDAAPGVRRLLVVGDSYAMGDGLDDPDARFGARLGAAATERTGQAWEVIHSSRTDTHTLQHLALLADGLRYRPDLVVLLYYFNDIDYLRPMVQRTAVTEHPGTLLARLRPDRWIFVNSFAFQELYLRVRQLRLALAPVPSADPYADPALVARHLRDLHRFVVQARGAGARVVIVPFDVGVTASAPARERYDRFIADCEAAGLPVLPARQALTGRKLGEMSVNTLDRHPNEEANALLARYVLPHFLRLGESGASIGSGHQVIR